MNKNLPPNLPALKAGWSWIKLGDVCEITSSKRIYKNEYVENGIPFFRTKEIVELSNGEKPSTELFISRERYKEIKSNYGVPQKGDILLSAIGTIGNMIVINSDAPFYFKDGNLLWIRSSQSVMPNFIKYSLEYLLKKNIELSGSAYYALTIIKLKQFHIPLPSLFEQERIVDKLEELLSELDKGVENLSNAKEQIKTYRQSVLKWAFEGRLTGDARRETGDIERPHKVEQITNLAAEPKVEYKTNNLPAGWKWRSLNDITTLLGDGLHGTPKYSEDGEFYFINGNNLSDGIIEIKPNTKSVSIEEYEKYKKFLNDKTVFVSINGTLGNTAFYNGEKIILGKSACYFNLKENVNKRYIRYYLTSQRFINYANKTATGSTIKNVSLKAIREFDIPLPPTKEEQSQIVSEIERRFSVADKLEQTIDDGLKKAEMLKQSILNKVFNGELV